MFRRFFLLAIMAGSPGLFAQQQSQPGSRPTGQPAGINHDGSPNVIVVPSGPSVYVVGGAYGAYLTPLGTLPVQDTGITLAGRQGISLETPIQMGAVTAVPSPFTFGAPLYSPVPWLAGGTAACAGEAESERLIYDLGPSYYVGGLAPSAPALSLGEVSKAYKQGHPRAVRVYTNADAERLSHNTLTIPSAAPATRQPQAPQQNPPPKPPPQREDE